MSKHYLPGIIIIILSVISILTAFAFSKNNEINKPVENVADGFAVVELFTSEGCSSCPPADKNVESLLSKKIKNVFILSYHVDYWNKLGWKDPFSKAIYSQRQQQYGAAFDLDGVYTPQIVINGSEEFVGSDEQKLSAAVERNFSNAAISHINIDTKENGNLLTINYSIDGNDTGLQLLNIALVQPQATTEVKKGENGGRKLHHVNIVRELKTIDAATKGIITIEIPGDLTGVSLQVIAYTQEKKTLHVSGVIQKAL